MSCWNSSAASEVRTVKKSERPKWTEWTVKHVAEQLDTHGPMRARDLIANSDWLGRHYTTQELTWQLNRSSWFDQLDDGSERWWYSEGGVLAVTGEWSY